MFDKMLGEFLEPPLKGLQDSSEWAEDARTKNEKSSNARKKGGKP